MKDESIQALLDSGEIQMTDDVIFMLDTITGMFERGMEQDNGGQFIGYAVQLMEVWRNSLATNDAKELVDENVMNIIMGKTAP